MCRVLRAGIKYWAVQESSARAFLSVASMQLGARRWEYPLRGPFCSADPVVGVVVQRKGEQKEPRQPSEANSNRDVRLPSAATPPH